MNAARERIIDCLPPRKEERDRQPEPVLMRRNQVWLVVLIVAFGFVMWWIFGRKSS